MEKYFYLLILGFWGAIQNVSSVCREEMFFTDFSSTATAPTPYHTVTDGTVIREYKTNGNNVVATFTPRVAYASSAAQVGAGGYGVVRRPLDVNANYNLAGTAVPMIIFPFGTANYADLLSIELTGLDRAESYIVTIKAMVIYRAGCPSGNNGTFGVFGFRDNIGRSEQRTPTYSARDLPVSETMMAIAQSDFDGKLSFTLLSGYNSQACIAAIGFTSIEVIGCPLVTPAVPGTPRPDPCPAPVVKPNSCDVVSATVFESTGDWVAKSFYTSTIKFIGGEGVITTPFPKGGKSLVGVPDATGRVYAVVENPNNINPNFPDIDKPMILLPTFQTMGAANANIMQYIADGLAPGKQYNVVVEGYLITSGCAAYAGTPQLSLCLNGTCTSTNITTPTTANPITCFTINGSCTTGAAQSSVELILRTAGNFTGTVGLACEQVYGITKIEIKGSSATPNVRALVPKILSSQGEEVCRNEPVRFSLDKNYNACTYKWEMSLTGAANSWTTVGSNSVYLEEVTQSAYYRCTINEGRPGAYGYSDPFYLAVIDCCNEEDGGSRVTLFYDDFGHFLSKSLYVTVTGETIPTCNGNLRTIMDPVPNTIPAGWEAPNMPGVVFDQRLVNAGGRYQGNLASCQTMNPGDISITAVPDIYAKNYANMAAMGMDASGDPNGGVLFFDAISTLTTDDIYRRRIDGLCEEKMTYFQVDYAAANYSTTLDKVTLAIYARNADGSKRLPVLASRSLNLVECKWSTNKLEFVMPAGYTSIYLCIEYTQTCREGGGCGDFMIDNVKFMGCTQPAVNAFSNIETLQQDTSICGDLVLNFGTLISKKVKNAYGGEDMIRVIYQHSTDNITWKNITEIVPDLSKNVDMKDYPGQRNYFRVVVAEDAALQKFLTNPDAEIYASVCRTTSISESFMIFREGTLNMGDDETLSGCKGEQLTLNGTTETEEPQIIAWEWTDASGNILAAKSSDPTKRNITHIFNSPTTIYFVGYNKNDCYARKRFIINEKPKVTISLSETGTCGETTVTATSNPASGVTYSWRYSNGAAIGSTASSVTLNASNYSDGTISVSGTNTNAGYCASDTVRRDITLSKKPLPPTVTTPLIYPVEAGNADVTNDANVQYTAGNTLYWRDNSGNLLPTPVLQNKMAPGTYSYWVGQYFSSSCRSDSTLVTVIVSNVSVPDARDSTICQGAPLNLSDLAKATLGDLLWYENITDLTGMSTPPTANVNTPGNHYYYVSQKVGDEESGKVPVGVTVIEQPEATISYAGTPFCTSIADAKPVSLSGKGAYTQGTYTVDPPTGLELSVYGDVIPNLSAAGNYTVTYTMPVSAVCNTEVATAEVVITKLPTVVSISYSKTEFCKSDDDEKNINLNGDAGGVYSANSGGLFIDSSTGTITPSLSDAGSYTVTYTIAGTGGCGDVTATINYNGMPFCSSLTEGQAVELTVADAYVNGAYTYASPVAGVLSLNASTGAIIPATSAPGSYNVIYTIPAYGGCDAVTADVNVTITQAPDVTISYSNPVFCSSEGVDQPVSFTGGVGDYENGLFSVSPAGLSLSTDGAILPNDSEFDTYTVTYTIPASGGCASKDVSTIVTITDQPSADISYSATEFCDYAQAQQVSLTGTPGGKYSSSPAGLSLNTETGEITPGSSTPGSYTVTYTIEAGGGCEEVKASTTVTINAAPVAKIDADTKVLTCNNPSIELTASGGSDYSWSHSLGNDAVVTVNIDATYTVTVTLNGCTDTESVTITADGNIPTISIASNGTTVLTCEKPAIVLTASGADTFVWNGNAGGSSFTVTEAGEYSVTGEIEETGCVGSNKITITSDKTLPTISVNNAAICSGDNATLTANGADSYIWTPSDGSNTITGKSITITPEVTISYTVEGLVTESGCKNRTTATVNVEQPLILSISAPEKVELGDEVTLTVTANGAPNGSYDWFINNILYETTDESYLTLEPAAGKQLFRVETLTTVLGCFATTEFRIDVNESIPNIINPHNPVGTNCCFMMGNDRREGYRVEIYNRYSQKVFEGDNGWDGTYRGVVADPGTYFYRLYKKSGEVEMGTLEVVRF